MKRYALVDQDGTIVNRIVLDDVNSWKPDEGFIIVEETTSLEIGGRLVDGKYTPPKSDPLPELPFILSVTPRQARIALLQAGLLDQVEAAVDASGGSAKITWEYATVISRDDALIKNIGDTLGLTDAAIDLLFKKAAAIN